MMDARNSTSHSYDEKVAAQIVHNITNAYVVGVADGTFHFADFKCRIDIIEYQTAYSATEPFTISVRYSTFYHYNNTTNQCLGNLLTRAGIYSAKSRT